MKDLIKISRAVMLVLTAMVRKASWTARLKDGQFLAAQVNAGH
jgi:hypothetical protein